MYNDSLYRVSFKCLIEDEQGHVLVVKESGRSSWDLPGGGIDHGETIQQSIKRELREEVAYEGDFTYRVLTVDDPVKLRTREVWQIKVIVVVKLDTIEVRVGDEADEIAFIDPKHLEDSEHESERRVSAYFALMKA